MSIKYNRLVKILRGYGFKYKRNTKGSHQLWSNGKRDLIINKRPKEMSIGWIHKVLKLIKNEETLQ